MTSTISHTMKTNCKSTSTVVLTATTILMQAGKSQLSTEPFCTRGILTIPWKSSSLTASIDWGSYSIHGMKATLLSWSSQLCHQGIITEEMRRLQGHHKPIQQSVSLYSRDDVNGQLELQRRLIAQVVSVMETHHTPTPGSTDAGLRTSSGHGEISQRFG